MGTGVGGVQAPLFRRGCQGNAGDLGSGRSEPLSNFEKGAFPRTIPAVNSDGLAQRVKWSCVHVRNDHLALVGFGKLKELERHA